MKQLRSVADVIKHYRGGKEMSYDPTEGNPEGYCPECEDHTTQIDRFGCCRECGTEVEHVE